MREKVSFRNCTPSPPRNRLTLTQRRKEERAHSKAHDKKANAEVDDLRGMKRGSVSRGERGLRYSSAKGTHVDRDVELLTHGSEATSDDTGGETGVKAEEGGEHGGGPFLGL